MKLIKRIKDILFDEEEVEIPVIERESSSKKELTNVNTKSDETKDSITEIKMPEDDFSDKENLKSELTFPFPIEFDEDELEYTKPIETPTRKPEIRSTRENSYSSRYEVKKEVQPTREIKDYSSYLKTKEEKKQFKPTPIISTVYGVLDQNYKKEDIIVKEETIRKPVNKDKLDLDEIRKRAYGENSFEEENTKEIEVSDVDYIELDPNKTIGELFEEESIKMPALDNTNYEEPTVELNDLIEEKENIEKKLQETEEDDETDLFSLIDSMYESNNE